MIYLEQGTHDEASNRIDVFTETTVRIGSRSRSSVEFERKE